MAEPVSHSGERQTLVGCWVANEAMRKCPQIQPALLVHTVAIKDKCSGLFTTVILSVLTHSVQSHNRTPRHDTSGMRETRREHRKRGGCQGSRDTSRPKPGRAAVIGLDHPSGLAERLGWLDCRLPDGLHG